MTPSRRLLSLPAYAWDKSRWWHEAPDWREGRLAPGGRGLLDIAPAARHADLDRAARQPPHGVPEGPQGRQPRHFPGGRLSWTWCSKRACSLFEGRPFVVEDFEIRKPLILPDPASDVHLEISYDPNERTFAIQSRFEHGAAWSLHVVGSMRGERTESPFAATTYESAATPGTGAGRGRGLLPLHERSRAALRRGVPPDPRARGGRRRIRRTRLAFGNHRAARRGISAASGAVRRRAADLLRRRRHGRGPPVEHEAARAFRAHPVPALARRVRARAGRRARNATRNLSKAASVFTTKPGEPCVLVDGFRAISVAGVRRAGAPGGTRDVIYHVDWERTPATTPAAPRAPLPLAQLAVPPPQRALDAGDQPRAVAPSWKPRWPPATISPPRMLAHGLREMGAVAGQPFHRGSSAASPSRCSRSSRG